MELELLRSLTDSLNDPVAGVNAALAALTRDGSDPQPADVVTIADETRHGAVARGRFPTGRPAIAVNINGKYALEGEAVTGKRDTLSGDGIPVLLRIAVADVSSENGATQAWYYVRALRRAVRLWLENDRAAVRLRNSVQLIECVGMEQLHLTIDAEDQVFVAPLLLHIHARDITP